MILSAVKAEMQALAGVDGCLVAGIGVAQDSHAGVANQRVFKALSGFARAIGDDGQARAVSIVGKPMNSDEIGAGGAVEQRVEDRPIGDGVAAVAHVAGLA